MRIHVTFDFGNEKSSAFTFGGEPEAKAPEPAKPEVKEPAKPPVKAAPRQDSLQQTSIHYLRAEARRNGIDPTGFGGHKRVLLALINDAKAKAKIKEDARLAQEKLAEEARDRLIASARAARAQETQDLTGMNVGEAINRLFRLVATANQSEATLRAAEKQLAKVQGLRS
jgi:hypothetical protein